MKTNSQKKTLSLSRGQILTQEIMKETRLTLVHEARVLKMSTATNVAKIGESHAGLEY